MKKLLSLLVLLTMSASLWATEVTIDGIKYNVIKTGKIAKVLSNSYKGDIVIPETVTYDGVVCNVTEIADNAFASCNQLKSVIIPNSITTMGVKVFYYSSVESVSLGNGISQINVSMFCGCSNLTSIIIPESVTVINNSAFKSCTSLASITFPDNVEIIGDYTFQSCISLTKVIIGDGVTSIGKGAFASCTNLSSVFIGPKVTTIGDEAFANTALTSVKIPNNVKTLGVRIFQYCKNMLSAQIGTGLSEIPNYAFESCSQLMSLTIREGITRIGKYAFQGCKDLIVVVIPGSVFTIDSYAFKNCTKLYNLGFNEGLKSIGASAFLDCTELDFVKFPNSLTTIGENAFKGCSKLATIMIGSGMTNIGSYAFSNLEELYDVYCEAINPPSLDGSNPFYNSYMQYATLHVPASSVATYQNTSPWKYFKEVIALDGQPQPEPPVLEKCAKPTITYDDGMLYFSCETAGVQFVYNIKNGGSNTGVSDHAQLVSNYYVSVYATKSGYEDSDTATKTFVPVKAIKGDVNEDGKVTITDAVSVVNIILNSGSSAPKMEAPDTEPVEVTEPE